jgi:hypothetical protein
VSRTTSQSVKAVLKRDYDSRRKPSLDPSIEWANIIVNRIVRCAARKNLIVDPSELEIIERWLAAHEYMSSDQGYKANTTNRASATYQGETKMYIEGTKYGQNALLLDDTGCLAQIASRMTAEIGWMGKTPSEEIPYDQRD